MSSKGNQGLVGTLTTSGSDAASRTCIRAKLETFKLSETFFNAVNVDQEIIFTQHFLFFNNRSSEAQLTTCKNWRTTPEADSVWLMEGGDSTSPDSEKNIK